MNLYSKIFPSPQIRFRAKYFTEIRICSPTVSPASPCICVRVRFPHKTFIYSNDLEEVPRVPGRLALETGDRLSFLPSFPICSAGAPVFISIPRWWLSSFDPVPCPPENETASHDQTRATRRDAAIYRASIIAIPVDIHSALLSPFFPSPFASPREDETGETESVPEEIERTCGHVGEQNSLRYCGEINRGRLLSERERDF